MTHRVGVGEGFMEHVVAAPVTVRVQVNCHMLTIVVGPHGEPSVERRFANPALSDSTHRMANVDDLRRHDDAIACVRPVTIFEKLDAATQLVEACTCWREGERLGQLRLPRGAEEAGSEGFAASGRLGRRLWSWLQGN